MSKARLVITAVTVEKRSVSEVARSYGVARSWIYALLARHRAEGEAGFEPRSRRPKTSPRLAGPRSPAAPPSSSSDPVKGAAAIGTVASPPARLQLGADSVAAVEEKLRRVTAELSQWRELAISTAHDDGA